MEKSELLKVKIKDRFNCIRISLLNKCSPANYEDSRGYSEALVNILKLINEHENEFMNEIDD